MSISAFNFTIESIAIFGNQCIHAFFDDVRSGFLFPFFACTLLKGCKHCVICGVGFCSSVDSCIFRFFIRIYGSSGHPTSKHLIVDVFRIGRSFNSSAFFKNWFLHFSTVHHPSVCVWRDFLYSDVVSFACSLFVVCSSGSHACGAGSQCSRFKRPSGIIGNNGCACIIISSGNGQAFCAESFAFSIFSLCRLASDCKWFHSFLWFRTVCIGNRDRLDVECTSSISKRDAYIARSWKFFHRNRLCTILVTAPSGSRLLSKNDIVAHFNGTFMSPIVACTRNRYRWNLFSRKSTSRQCHLFWSSFFA